MAACKVPVKQPALVNSVSSCARAQEESAGGFRRRLSPGGNQTLETLAEQVGVDFFPSDVGQSRLILLTRR